MAFLLSKCKGVFDESNKYFFTFQSISRWSERENNAISSNPAVFFHGLSILDQNEYLTLQEEALKMLQWLKRYARAFQMEV